MVRPRSLLLFALLYLLFQPALSQVLGNDRVSSSISHAQIGLDETATLTVQVKGVNDVVDVQTPAVRPGTGLQIVPVGRQLSMTTINGVTETSTKFNYLLTPLEKGRFVIESTSVVVNGITYETESHRIEVTDAMGRGRPRPSASVDPWGISPVPGIPNFPSAIPDFEPPSSGEDFLLESELEPQIVFKHEPAIYNLRLFAGARLMRDPRYSPVLPTGLIPVTFPQESSQEYRNGRGYNVTQASTAFFPMTEGTYEFPASEVSLSTGAFSQLRTMRTKPQTLQVLPLPTEGRPESFTGAVGRDFDITATVKKSQIKAGQVIELEVEVTGEANLDLVPYPFLPNWPGVEKKQVDGSSKVEVEDRQVRSERTYRFRLKMKEPGNYELKDIALAYFRPETEQYEVLKAAPISVDVVAADDTTSEESIEEETTLSATDAPKREPGPSSRVVRPVSSSIYLAGLGLSLLGLLMAFLKPGPGRISLPNFRGKARPRDLQSLESCLVALAPGADRLERQEQLTKRGWSGESVADFERLKTRVAAIRYGSSQSDDNEVNDLIDSFQRLQKGAEK